MSEIERIPTDAIEIGNRRECDPDVVNSLAQSMERVGLLSPILVYTEDNATVKLVAGRHRLRAAVQLGWEFIDAIFVNAIDARLMEISENLHRSELTVQERSDQIAEWVKLVSSNLDETKREGRPGAQAAASRELGVSTAEVKRAVKIAGLSDEAKEVARETGLDDNQSALLRAARFDDPEAQVVALRSRPKPDDDKPNPISVAWNKATKKEQQWFVRAYAADIREAMGEAA